MSEYLTVDKTYPGLKREGYRYVLDGDLVSVASLRIVVPLYVTGKIKAGKWIEAGEEINAGGGIKGSVKQVFGVNTSYYVPLQLHWPVYLFADKMKIGCQLHSIETWKSFTDEVISGMDSHALDFWNTYKDILFGIHDKMSKQTKQENGKCF